ncbi:MAG TPA: class I SAM-dependent methyltransferase [Flavobacterium sp.]|nr:class I SAM-dependent methyltransferase [Flavobacterium sp.]
MSRLYGFLKYIYHLLPESLVSKNGINMILKKLNPDLSTRNLPRISDRKAIILSKILPATQEGIEIGALCWPMVTKEESGGKIYYVDFSTAEYLREKYKNDPNVNISDIVDTDYLWGEQTLPELVNGKLFDYVVASHVIEHVPNMLGWLREIALVLKDNGILALAIPDKRFTFDYKRDLTSLGTLVESYLMDKRRPGIKDIFDQVSLATKVNALDAWNKKIDSENLEHHGTIQQALEQAKKYLSSEEYEDVHVNILTPLSFLKILEQACQLDLVDFVIAEFSDTTYGSHEFFVSLQRVPRSINKEEKSTLQAKNFLTYLNKIS